MKIEEAYFNHDPPPLLPMYSTSARISRVDKSWPRNGRAAKPLTPPSTLLFVYIMCALFPRVSEGNHCSGAGRAGQWAVVKP